jgi:hypothetical protein
MTTRVIPAIAASPQPPSLPQHQTPIALYLHVEYVRKIQTKYFLLVVFLGL